MRAGEQDPTKPEPTKPTAPPDTPRRDPGDLPSQQPHAPPEEAPAPGFEPPVKQPGEPVPSVM